MLFSYGGEEDTGGFSPHFKPKKRGCSENTGRVLPVYHGVWRHSGLVSDTLRNLKDKKLRVAMALTSE